MQNSASPDDRTFGPLPRKDILAVCSFLNRRPGARAIGTSEGPEFFLERLAAAARMQ
jgi:hypothetical protein